uniref:Uncharacterized protein n=1 Tax=Panagrolaimus sp. JU765 TaxID=591449 RepID=A0AC34QYD7_9BILA
MEFEECQECEKFGEPQFFEGGLLVSEPVYRANFRNSWLGLRGPNSACARGTVMLGPKRFQIEGKTDFIELFRDKMQQEIIELNRKNAVLENEKERLVSELVNLRVNGTKPDNVVVDVIQNVPKSEECAMIEEFQTVVENLQKQLEDSKKAVQKLEVENGNYSERCFDLEMDKQRLTIKLHQSLQQCCNLKDSNQELKQENEKYFNEKTELENLVRVLEAKIEKMEDGDFEHLEKDEVSAIGAEA